MFRRSKAKDPFFAAFSRHAQLTVSATGVLRQLLEQPDPLAERKREITRLEHEGDEITRATMTRLRSQWITPLDRPDIHALTTRLDDVLDAVESIAERLELFDIHDSSKAAVDAARVLESCAIAMAKAVELLPEARKRARDMIALCAEITKLESDGDAIYRSAIAELFQAGNQVLTVMKWRDIHEQLENATDLCEDVANTLEGVVLEYT
jgi:predicted phosphate transport protein (TIGR00153 family)